MRVLFGLLILLAGPVSAQGVWQSYGPAEASVVRGATVCPYNDAESGHFYCFGLYCRPGSPVEFSLMIVGGDLPDQMQALVEVDGSLAGTLDFVRTPNRDVFQYQAPFNPEWHPALVQRLSTGRAAAINLFGFNNQKMRQEIGLGGASAALGAVMGACPLPVPAPVTDPAAKVLAEITEMCTSVGGTVTVNKGFRTEQDVNLDGRPDLILDYGGAVCSRAASLFCGSAGCSTDIWLSRPDGSYGELFSGNVRGLEIMQLPVLRLNLHGSACGLIGAAPCVKDFTIVGEELLPLE